MAEKKDEKMTPTTDVKKIEDSKPAIVVQEMKQSQTFLNLETMEEDSVDLKYSRFTVNENKVSEAMKELHKIVSPDLERAKALANYASSQAYQVAKKTALSKGTYFTPAMGTVVVQLLSGINAYADLSAADCKKRFVQGVKDKKPGALKILAQARTILESQENTEVADF